MEDERESRRSDRIRELILREKDAAERHFESTRFEARLFERIRNTAEAGRPLSRPALLRRQWPVVAFSVLVLAVAAFLLSRAFSPSPFQRTIRVMGSVLSEAGGRWQTAEGSSLFQRGITPEYTDFGWALKGVLYACERESLGDVGLAESLARVLTEENPQPAPPRDGSKPLLPGSPSLQLKSGEDFRMFFATFLKKLEEV
jgi:hypothetical protein